TKGVQPAAATLAIQKHARAVDDPRAPRLPTGDIVVFLHLPGEPLVAWDPQERFQRIGVGEDAVDVVAVDVDAELTAPVVAEAAVETVGEVTAPEDRGIDRAQHGDAIAGGKGAGQGEQHVRLKATTRS